MNKTWIVLRHEINTLLHSRSFLLGVFLFPALGFLILLGVGILQKNMEIYTSPEALSGEAQSDVKGLVDYSGIIREIPAELKGRIQPFDDEESGLQALEAGKITVLFVVSEDYLKTGKVRRISPRRNPFSGDFRAYPVDWLIEYNLFKDRPDLLQRLVQPMNLEEETLSSKKTRRDQNELQAFAIPYGTSMIFYLLIFWNSSLMLSSVNTEKKNRVIEILLTSITPHEIMAGKMLGLGIMGLFQTLIWLIAARLALSFAGRSIPILQGLQIPQEILVWGIVYFLLGYAVFSSMMASIGALAPNLKEASQVTILVALPLYIPFLFLNVLIFRPDSIVSVALSLFPLTSPVAMITRLSATAVPFWQLALAAVLQALTAWLVIRMAAGMFRAQNLLSGQTFNLKVFIKALAGKA